MELADGVLRIDAFLAVTLGIIVLFVGKRWNDRIGFLREFSIPEPVTGGILFSVLFLIVYATTGVAVDFDLAGERLGGDRQDQETGPQACMGRHRHRPGMLVPKEGESEPFGAKGVSRWPRASCSATIG